MIVQCLKAVSTKAQGLYSVGGIYDVDGRDAFVKGALKSNIFVKYEEEAVDDGSESGSADLEGAAEAGRGSVESDDDAGPESSEPTRIIKSS